MTDRVNLRQRLQHTVLHLLDEIRDAVRAVHLDRASLLVHRELVPLQVEGLVCESEILDGAVLAEGIVVEVAGIEPAADVEPRDVLPGPVRGVRVRAHPVAVEVRYVRRRLQSVGHVRDAMPKVIGIAHRHVIHLHGEKAIERRLPGLGVDVPGYGEHAAAPAGVLDHVQAGPCAPPRNRIGRSRSAATAWVSTPDRQTPRGSCRRPPAAEPAPSSEPRSAGRARSPRLSRSRRRSRPGYARSWAGGSSRADRPAGCATPPHRGSCPRE